MYINERHKKEVNEGGYGYMGTYQMNDIMLDRKKLKTNKHTFVLIVCPYCKNRYSIDVSLFKRGLRCNKCCHSYEKSVAYWIEVEMGLRLEDVLDMNKNLKEGLNPYHIHKYSNCRHLWWLCENKKHNSYKQICSSHVQGHGCAKCNGGVRLTYEEVKEYIESFNYKLISNEYKGGSKKLKLKCPNGHDWEVTYENFKGNKSKKGTRCPHCNISKGEQKIMDFLNKNEIYYIYDSPYFDNLLSPLGNPLRPDFILPDYKIWIEYDGEFHYKKYYENQNFEILQTHDEIKNNYAKENKWKMIRIPYWDFDSIEKILELEFNAIFK